MKKEIPFGTEKYEKSHRRKSIWHRVISVLSAITVFVTTYAMNLPAITMEPTPGVRLEQPFYYEDDRILLIAQVNGRATPEDGERTDELSPDRVQMQVKPLADSSSVRQAYVQYAHTNIGTEDMYDLLTLQLDFTHDGQTLDMRLCEIQVQVIAKEALFEPGDAVQAPLRMRSESSRSAASASAAQQDAVMAMTAFQGVSGDLMLQDTGYQTEESGTLSVSTMLTGNTMAVALYSTVNPVFTVQYYAYFEKLATTGDKALDEIDTSGGKLPENGGQNTMTKIWLNAIGDGKYVLATETVLGVLQNQIDDYQYVKAPGVAYVDRLRENGNYALDEVWVLKSGKNSGSTDRSDWDIYPSTVGFTNHAESAGSNRIYITDQTVIRLVYTTTQGSYTNAADFYDYDISDGYTHRNGIYTAVTANNGINSFTAAGGTAKYAFGNVNTMTNYGDITWSNNGYHNAINKYNSVNAAYDGCTFGMVTGIHDDGTLIFADGISAPALFGRADGKGKTYFDDYSLQFSRSGDTYTLVAVNGTGTRNLDQFNNPSYTYAGETTTYSHIFTNNFWPMDTASTWGASGHDPVFGSIAKHKNGTVVGKNGDTTKPLPPSDDGKDHNSYFGMQYKLTFTLTEDYRGPLDYVFYGDDDMWVFLDGQLVCDIGGVHSSVGQYVNLRDYIDKMPEAQRYGEHTLYFCYTERGASGSSCYMRFTLPSVSIETPQVESDTLELKKQVHNATTDREFDFAIELTDEDGNALVDDYSYTRFNAAGEALESGIINSAEKNVKLRHGEKLIIDYLPRGTRFLVRETAAPGFSAVYSVNGSTPAEGSTVSGTIQSDTSILFINSSGPLLPETGGTGWLLYGLPLGLAFVTAVALPLAEKLLRKQKNKT